MLFTEDKIKHLLRFLYLIMGYGLRKYRVPRLRTKRSGLDNLITELLKKWMFKRNAS